VLLEQLLDFLAVLPDRSVIVAELCEKQFAQLRVFGECIPDESTQVVGRHVV
jgi:hypothetical protein